MSSFFKKWEDLKASQVKSVQSLFKMDAWDWSEKEKQVKEVENDLGGIKKLEVVKDE